jgi:hypothetical protein
MHANNEVGTLQPISAIARVAREHGILFHTDAAQSVGKIPTAVDEMSDSRCYDSLGRHLREQYLGRKLLRSRQDDLEGLQPEQRQHRQLPQQRRSQQHQPHAWRRRPVLVTGTSRTTVWAFLVKLA